MTIRDALLRARGRPRHFGAGSPTVYRGDGYEFVELRTYVPGDDVRRIDWAATARSSELQSRVILEDVALTLAAFVDTSASMCVGRHRPLLDAAEEALKTWYESAIGEDRCMRIWANGATPYVQQRVARSALARLSVQAERFDPKRTFATARGVLPRGAALLAIGDWYDLDDALDRELADLGTRFDCTALVARDPWYDGLPLRGIVRLRGAEGGRLRAYVGRRERSAYAYSVRERERKLIQRFHTANWRVSVLLEDDGRRSLAAAFGLPATPIGTR